jgi:putative methyltransferase (TIGR04325 family)
MKSLVKDILPPAIYRHLKRLKPKHYGWLGNYPDWQSAVADSDGYDKQIILDKVSTAIEQVIAGKAAFERDSVLFETQDYNWPFISALMYVAANHEGNLHLIDFGGSLGSSYFQNRLFFSHLKSVSWNVVEQAHFVERGQEKFSNNELHFYSAIKDCLNGNKIDTLLLSSVLQYIEKPYQLLEEIFAFGFKTIIIDRMPFNTAPADRISVQKVHPAIYKASYPCHLLNVEYFKDFFLKHNYKLLTEFDAIDGKSDDWQYKGFIFERY